MTAIFDRLNPVEAERFIYLLLSEPFDYTEWQRNLFNNMTLDEISAEAVDHCKANPR